MSAAAALPVRRPSSQVNANAVLAVVAIAQFMTILDASVVNVALPTIKRDLGFSEQSGFSRWHRERFCCSPKTRRAAGRRSMAARS